MSTLDSLLWRPAIVQLPAPARALILGLRCWGDVVRQEAPVLPALRLALPGPLAPAACRIAQAGTVAAGVWPEPLRLARPGCGCALTPDEWTLAQLALAADGRDRPAFDRLCTDMLAPHARDLLHLHLGAALAALALAAAAD